MNHAFLKILFVLSKKYNIQISIFIRIKYKLIKDNNIMSI